MIEINPQVLRVLGTPNDAYGDLFEACNDLYESLLNLTGINTEQEDLRQNLSLNSGKAIGLAWAAMCIKDIMRTKKFMDGVSRATIDCLKEKTRRPLHIIYAGTGPFATLMLPLTVQFSSEEIQFTLLEVNEDSHNCLQSLIKKLNLEKYVHRLEKADATQWRLPPGEMVDLFICETMTQGLRSEPQVAICLNIVPQLPAETIIIPENVTLQAALINPKSRTDKLEWKDTKDEKVRNDGIIVLEDILVLNKKSILEFQKIGPSGSFPPVNITIDPVIGKTHPVLYALTQVFVYKEHNLLMDESALTMPMKLMEVEDLTSIQLQYNLGENPGIRVNLPTKKNRSRLELPK